MICTDRVGKPLCIQTGGKHDDGVHKEATTAFLPHVLATDRGLFVLSQYVCLAEHALQSSSPSERPIQRQLLSATSAHILSSDRTPIKCDHKPYRYNIYYIFIIYIYIYLK